MKAKMTMIAALAGLAAPIAGCGTKASTPLPQEQILTGQMLNQSDGDFVTESYRIVQLDNQEGQMAASQSGDPRVRALAAEIVGKANQLYPLLEDAIGKNGITPPRALPGELQKKVDRLHTQRGRAFDRLYLADQVESHLRAASVFEREQTRTTDVTMRSLADRALPVVQDSLAKLQALQAQMR